MKKLILAVLMLFSSSAFALGSASASLSWDHAYGDANPGAVTTYSMERKAESCTATVLNFAEVFVVPGTARTAEDTAIQQGKTYCYRVYAIGPGGKSGPSNVVAKIVPFGIPTAPENLQVK